MSLGTLGNTIQVLSAIFSSGGVSGRRQIIIEGPTGRLTIPVTPAKYTVGDGQKNKVVDITQVGEAPVFGMPKARTLSFPASSRLLYMIIRLSWAITQNRQPVSKN